MSTTWNARVRPDAPRVLVLVKLEGPTGRIHEAQFVLDTGTEVTVIDRQFALDAGFTEKQHSEGRSRLIGPTGPDEGYKVRPPTLSLMGKELREFLVRCHDVSAKAGVRGLIGMDIVRMGELTLNLPWGLFKFQWP